MEDKPMVDPAQELMLEQFRLIHATLAVHGRKLDEVLYRLSTREIGFAGMRRELAGHGETVAHLQARVDRMEGQINRINLRLDLTENPA